MKTSFTLLLLLLLLWGTASARKPFLEGPQVNFGDAVAYTLPVDTCEYVVSMFFDYNLVRSRETLVVKFYLVGAGGELSKPATMLIQGNAASRRQVRMLRRAGKPTPVISSGKARRGEVYTLDYTMLVPDKEPWMDQATQVKVEQSFQRGQHTEILPEQHIPLRHVEGRNASRHGARNANAD